MPRWYDPEHALCGPDQTELRKVPPGTHDRAALRASITLHRSVRPVLVVVVGSPASERQGNPFVRLGERRRLQLDDLVHPPQPAQVLERPHYPLLLPRRAPADPLTSGLVGDRQPSSVPHRAEAPAAHRQA